MSKIKKGERVFEASNSTIVGNVCLGDDVSVWYGAVIRGDNDKIEIGARTNIQDLAVLHVDEGYPIQIGEDCVVGHLSIVHGATIGHHVVVGMHSTIMNGAKIGNFCIIGANSLVVSGTEIPDYSLVIGSPAKVLKPLTDEQIQGIQHNVDRYLILKDANLKANLETDNLLI